MATNIGGAPQPAGASELRSSPLSGLLAPTASFFTSQLGALTTFFGAVTTAVLCFKTFQTSLVGLGLSPRECAAIVIVLVALLFFSYTLPTLLEKRRNAKLGEVTGSTKPRYFQLAPREDEDTYQRADGKQDEVLKWLRQPPARVLYLTGSSGTGKSSLLTAWVLPKLEREGVKVIRLRGYQDPAQVLEEELKRSGVIWKKSPPETTDLQALFEEALRRIRPDRILVVFDQFEEFLILQEERQRARFAEFLITQSALKETGAAILLVFRAEYDGFVQDLNLPSPIPGKTLQKVTAFTQRAALEFLAGSGLKIQDQLMADVLREAAEVEETKGLIRPVTLNLCGLVLARFATGLPHSYRPGRMIRGFVHEAIFQKDVREATPVLLPRLISHQVTKRPCTIDELAKGVGFTPRQAKGFMFKLAAPEWGMVHALDPEHSVWEISHDFLVTIIDSILAHWRVSLWRKARPWIPLGYFAILLFAIFVAPRVIPDPNADPIAGLNRLHWQTRFVDSNDPNDQSLIQQGIKYDLSFNSIPPLESVRYLKSLPGRLQVTLNRLPSFDTAHFDGWSGLTQLASLELLPAYSSKAMDFSALKNLPQSLTTLDLSTIDWITDADLISLPKSLTTLNLEFDNLITDAGLINLPKSLTTLDVSSDAKITDVGLINLPKSLTTLDLNGDDKITDVGLKSLPKSLTTLYLQVEPLITDEGIRSLPSTVKVIR